MGITIGSPRMITTCYYVTSPELADSGDNINRLQCPTGLTYKHITYIHIQDILEDSTAIVDGSILTKHHRVSSHSYFWSKCSYSATECLHFLQSVLFTTHYY